MLSHRPWALVVVALSVLAGPGCPHPYGTIRRAVTEGRPIEVVLTRAEVVHWRADGSHSKVSPPESFDHLAEIFTAELRKQWGTDKVTLSPRVGGTDAEITVQLEIDGEYHDSRGVMELSLWVKPIRTRTGRRLHVSYGHRLGGQRTTAPSIDAAFAGIEASLHAEAEICAYRFAAAVSRY